MVYEITFYSYKRAYDVIFRIMYDLIVLYRPGIEAMLGATPELLRNS